MPPSQGLLTRALPPFGAQGVGGSTMVRRASSVSPLALHVNPVGRQETDLRVWPVAALVLVADPASQSRIDPAVAAAALGLTEMESRVAVLLAEGMNVREVAAATGRGESTIPLACEAPVRQARPVAAGGPGAAGAVAGRRSRVPALTAAAAAGADLVYLAVSSCTDVMLAGNWKCSRMVAPLLRRRHR